jgi:hypothetical protein
MTVYTPDSDEENVISQNAPVRKNVNENVNIIPSKIIGKPIRIGSLLVAQYSFPNQLTWYEAKKACAALGKGWRLPTINELKVLYQNRIKIRGFESRMYWSSTEVSSNGSWTYNFMGGDKQFDLNSNRDYVRAVRAF